MGVTTELSSHAKNKRQLDNLLWDLSFINSPGKHIFKISKLKLNSVLKDVTLLSLMTAASIISTEPQIWQCQLL